MAFIELSKKFLEKVKEAFNKILYEQEEPQRIEVITEAEEKPSPRPRLSKNEELLDDVDSILEEYIDTLMVGVTDTNSMEPLIDYGHQVILIPFKNDDEKKEIMIGDIIWFRRMSDGNENVLHRVIEVHEGWVVTRGDNLVVSDGPIPFKDIKGYLGAVIY